MEDLKIVDTKEDWVYYDYNRPRVPKVKFIDDETFYCYTFDYYQWFEGLNLRESMPKSLEMHILNQCTGAKHDIGLPFIKVDFDFYPHYGNEKFIGKLVDELYKNCIYVGISRHYLTKEQVGNKYYFYRYETSDDIVEIMKRYRERYEELHDKIKEFITDIADCEGDIEKIFAEKELVEEKEE